MKGVILTISFCAALFCLSAINKTQDYGYVFGLAACILSMFLNLDLAKAESMETEAETD